MQEVLRKSLAGARLVRAVQCSSISPSTSTSSDTTKGLIGYLSEKCWVGDDRVKEKEREKELAKLKGVYKYIIKLWNTQ